MFFLSLAVKEIAGLPSSFGYVGDLYIGLIAVVVIARGIATNAISRIPLKYILVMCGFFYVTITGIVLNVIGLDTVIAGVRVFLKYIPVFLIPFVYRYTDSDIRILLLFFIALLVIQSPIAIYQRFFQFADIFTGDYVTGTLPTNAALTIFGCFCAVFALVAYLDKRITLQQTGVMCLLAIFPTSLAETKVTPFFLLTGMFAILLVRASRVSFKQLTALAGIGVLVLTMFVLLYNTLYPREEGIGFVGLITDKERMMDNYQMTGITAKPFELNKEYKHVVGTSAKDYRSEPVEVGRFDSLRLPIESLLPNEPLRFLFGLGIGNTDSNFGQGAEYLYVKMELGGSMTGLSLLMWETGLLGTIFFLTFICFVLRDAGELAKDKGSIGTISAGIFGCSSIILLNMIYANMFHQSILFILFSFFGGLVVSRLYDARAASGIENYSSNLRSVNLP